MIKSGLRPFVLLNNFCNTANKFAIITLRYDNSATVLNLLDPYIFIDVVNDLEGFRELVRALPIELGLVRWKAEVV